MKDKIESVTPANMNTLHLDDSNRKCDKLPTIREIYKEVAIEVLKFIVGIGCCIGCFLSGWYFFSELMDIVFV